MPQALKPSPEEAPNLNRRHDHNWYWNQYKHCQEPVLGKQDDQNADNRQAIHNQNLQAIHKKVVQLIDILRHTRDQCSCLTLVVIGQA